MCARLHIGYLGWLDSDCFLFVGRQNRHAVFSTARSLDRVSSALVHIICCTCNPRYSPRQDEFSLFKIYFKLKKLYDTFPDARPRSLGVVMSSFNALVLAWIRNVKVRALEFQSRKWLGGGGGGGGGGAGRRMF